MTSKWNMTVTKPGSTHVSHDPANVTGLLLVDPYNDFLKTADVRQRGLGRRVASDFAPREGDIVINEHWAQNGFVNTDLDIQPFAHAILTTGDLIATLPGGDRK